MTKTLYIIIGAIVTLLPASQSLGQQIPYQAEHRFAATECGPSGVPPFQCISTSFPSVPAGKRLVAERIVASAALDSGTLVESRINVNNVLVSFSFVPTLKFSSGGTSAVGDQTVLFYVDAAKPVQTAMFTDGAFTIDPSRGPLVVISVIGYLLDCTAANVCPPIAP